MALTKSFTSIFSAVTATTTSAAIAVTTSYASEVYVNIVVVGAPTVGASFSIQCSADTSTYPSVIGPFSAGIVALTYNFPPIVIPPGTSDIKIAYTAQTGGTSSTINAQVSLVTSL